MGLPKTAKLSSPASVGSSPSRGSPSEINVTKAPRITRPLNDTTVVEGKRASLECEIEGHPQPEIDWFKDGQAVSESRHLRLGYDGNCASLKIYEAHLEHEGEYTCRARSVEGTVESRARLFVEGMIQQ